ncbi:MAG: hypothetical protein ACRDAO_01465 [Culicoidibacterales bacterium]
MIHFQTIEIKNIKAEDIVEIRGVEFEGGYDPTKLIVEIIRPTGHYLLYTFVYNSGDYYRTGMPFDSDACMTIEQLFTYCQTQAITVYAGEHGYDVLEEMAQQCGYTHLSTLQQLAQKRKILGGAIRPLLTLANQTVLCEAKIMRFGERRNSFDETKTVLLTDITLVETGELLTDHLWTTYTVNFQSLAPYNSGEVICFEAKVMPYNKTSYGRSIRDFRLTQFQNIERVKGRLCDEN